MIGHILIAALLSAQTTPAPTLHVMTWNVCAGTNAACPLHRPMPPRPDRDYARSTWSDHVPLHAWISRR
ncbi:hypothetical protein ACWEPN_09300 [Nonomuraea wenchangensis]